MKPSGGVWLFTTGALYLELLVVDYLMSEPIPYEFIELAWVLIMSLPLFVSPLARFFNVKTVWES
jgi:hypothetical protein